MSVSSVLFVENSTSNYGGFVEVLPSQDTGNHNINRLRLYHLRSNYGLPEYPPHNALYDAFSTAELFLAQATRMEQNHLPLTFGQLL